MVERPNLESADDKKNNFKLSVIREILEKSNKQPLEEGDTVVTLDGPYARKKLFAIKKENDGMVRVGLENRPSFLVHESSLFNFMDYLDACQSALDEEELYKADNPN